MARSPLQRYSAGWATLLSQRDLGERPRYLAQSTWIDRDSLLREMEVRVPIIGRSRWHHSFKQVANIDARCRGPLSWKGEAMRSYRPARQMKAANLVLCMRYLSLKLRTRAKVRRWRFHHGIVHVHRVSRVFVCGW